MRHYTWPSGHPAMRSGFVSPPRSAHSIAVIIVSLRANCASIKKRCLASIAVPRLAPSMVFRTWRLSARSKVATDPRRHFFSASERWGRAVRLRWPVCIWPVKWPISCICIWSTCICIRRIRDVRRYGDDKTSRSDDDRITQHIALFCFCIGSGRWPIYEATMRRRRSSSLVTQRRIEYIILPKR